MAVFISNHFILKLSCITAIEISFTMNILQYREMVKETDLYLPMLQPLQYAKGWKKRPKGYIAISDLRSCLQKDCEHRPGKFGSQYREAIICLGKTF